MISSTIQRLPCRTCGLFDSGIAGDAQVITSTGLSAPADALSGFGLDGHLDTSFYPGVSGMKSDSSHEPVKVDSWFDDLDDLSGDPLGDDSMESFINLDKFLNGNSFFDEDGNLNVPDVQGEAAVTPVIDFEPQPEIISVSDPTVPNFTMVLDEQQDFLLPPEEIKMVEKSARKRSARKMEGIKTSLYEIPTSVISDAIQVESERVAKDMELDHDYSSKRQRMSVPVNRNTTSDTMKVFTVGEKEISQASTSSPNNGQGLNDSVDKQTIRRIKNNHASKRSREQRKQKFVDMDAESEELISRNQELRQKIVELEKLAKEMKTLLVAKMAGKSR